MLSSLYSIFQTKFNSLKSLSNKNKSKKLKSLLNLQDKISLKILKILVLNFQINSKPKKSHKIHKITHKIKNKSKKLSNLKSLTNKKLLKQLKIYQNIQKSPKSLNPQSLSKFKLTLTRKSILSSISCFFDHFSYI